VRFLLAESELTAEAQWRREIAKLIFNKAMLKMDIFFCTGYTFEHLRTPLNPLQGLTSNVDRYGKPDRLRFLNGIC
jgi:hypothetical protein